MPKIETGRHRAPGRLNPASSLSTAVSRAAAPASKASAVIAVSGGMVASFALPASAATMTTEVKAQAPARTTAALAPSAAPAPLVSRTFGEIAFEGVVKPQPVAVPVVSQRTSNRVSRSAFRTAVSPASTQTRQAAVPALGLSPQGTGVLGIAATLAGIPYRYGGTTRAGFDCSGFTQYVFAKAGVGLPRVAEAQRQATARVSRADARPGDLVFFGAPATHMGIYAGNGMMWDSPQTGQAISKRAIYSANATFGRV